MVSYVTYLTYLYVSKDISYCLIGKNLLKQADSEDIWIKLKYPGIKNELTIAIIYCHPKGNIPQLKKLLDKIFQDFKLSIHDLFILGDININLLGQSGSTNDLEFSSLLASNGLFSLVTKPTRVTTNSSTLIDHIYTNSFADPIFPRVILNDISDHYMIYCVISIANKSRTTNHVSLKSRNFKNINYELLARDLSFD